MKRYLVFSIIDYYPAGGWGDFDSSHEKLEDARAASARIEKEPGECGQIVDLETETVV